MSREYDAAHLDVRKRRSAILRPVELLRYARVAVEAAQSIESVHARSYGGHRHSGLSNPLLSELPLPSGWRKP